MRAFNDLQKKRRSSAEYRSAQQFLNPVTVEMRMWRDFWRYIATIQKKEPVGGLAYTGSKQRSEFKKLTPLIEWDYTW
jgi:hypothetical protein